VKIRADDSYLTLGRSNRNHPGESEVLALLFEPEEKPVCQLVCGAFALHARPALPLSDKLSPKTTTESNAADLPFTDLRI
jgi:hypothetical protein